MTPRQPLDEALTGSAVLSDDGVYRYRMDRTWGAPEDGTVLFVMLNPSVADADRKDPTTTRIIRYANRWGYGALRVVNLFAFRTKDPAELVKARDPMGPGNPDAVHGALTSGDIDLVVCAWGVIPRRLVGHRPPVEGWASRAGRDLHCLGRTADGQPLHPVRLSQELRPVIYRKADL